MAPRKPTRDEFRLLSALATSISKKRSPEWLDGLLVEPMDDSGMGSLRLLVRNTDTSGKFGCELSTCQFNDSDGVEVVTTLYGDTNGLPFEMDVWKVDFGRVKAIPQEIRAEPCDCPDS